MFKKKVTPNQQQGKSDAFNTSISDLMAGMLAVFILALCYFMINFGQITAERKEALDKVTHSNEIRKKLLSNIEETINEELKKNKLPIKVSADKDRGILPLPAGIFFDSGKAEIKEEGIKIIQVLGKALSEELEKKEFAETVDTIFIEGHTDDEAISEYSKFESNWQLSTERAIRTWDELQTIDGIDLKNRNNKNGQPFFSCSGYADTRPHPDAIIDKEHDSKEELERKRQINRRIDIRITMLPPTEDDLKDKGKKEK